MIITRFFKVLVLGLLVNITHAADNNQSESVETSHVLEQVRKTTSDNNQSYYRNFWNPKYHGKRLNYCLPHTELIHYSLPPENGDKVSLRHRTSKGLNIQKECGIAVANRYCRTMGYDKATKATIAYHIGLTNYFGGCTGCKGWNCNGFSLIRCVAQTLHKPARAYYFRSKKFVYPRMNHYRIDWCYKNGQGCGKRAAFSFCRRMGFMREESYQRDLHVAATKALGNQRLCFGDDCHGFSSITCYR